MKRPGALALGLACLAAVVLAPVPSSSQGTIYFRANFENPGPAGAQYYNFASKFALGQWQWTHLTTGGWNGTGAARIVMRAGQTQYQFGFVTPDLGRTFAMGDGVYFRFRIKFDSNFRVTNSWGNKFLMMGNSESNPNSRIILYLAGEHSSRGCTLQSVDWSTGSAFPWGIPSYFGITGYGSFTQAGLREHAWGIAPRVNIGYDCAGSIFQTWPGSPFSYARPGAPGSAPPSNGWYHVQVYAQSGGPGQGMFKTWANNNTFSVPSQQRIGFVDGLGVTGWRSGAHLGGYMDNDTPTLDLGYIIDDFEIGSAFDPSWYPGGSPGLPTPSPPQSLRILR